MYINTLCRRVLLAAVLCLSASCAKDVTSEYQQFDVKITNQNFQAFVDYFYQFGGENRLSLMWFGWYYSDSPNTWYESDQQSNFKISAELLSSENGIIFVNSAFEEGIVNISIHCGDGKEVWANIVEDFVAGIRESNAFSITQPTEVSCEDSKT